MPRVRGKPASPPARVVAIVAVLVACGSVVAFLPGGFSRWTWPKLLLAVGAIAVALFSPRTGRLPRWAWWVGGAGLTVLLIAAIASGDPSGLWGRWPRYTGPLVAVPVGIGAAWLGAALLGPASPRQVRRVFRDGLAVVAILIAAVALLETLGLRPIASELARPGSLLGNASDQAVVGVMIAAVLFAEVIGGPGGRRRWLTIGGLVAGLGAVTLSASRAGYAALLGALLGVMVLTVLARRRAGREPSVPRRVWAWLGGLVGAVLVFIVANPESLRRLFVRSGLADRPGDRWAIWTAALEVIAQAPWFGTGAGGFIDTVPAVLSAEWFRINGSGTTLESPHNWVLEVLTDGGLALLAVAVAGLVLAGRAAWRRVGEVAPDDAWLTHGGLAGSVAALAALSLYFVNAGVLVLGGVLLGSLIAVPREPRPAPGRRSLSWRTAGQRAAVIGWALALLVATVAEYPLARGVQGDPVDAGAAFATAQALRPWDGDIASIAAQTLAQAAQSGNPAVAGAAVAWGERAVGRLPRSAAALEAWAVALELSGDLPRAVEARTRMVAAVPNDAVARLNLAITLAVAGEPEAAVGQAERALELDASLEQAEELLVRICMELPISACER